MANRDGLLWWLLAIGLTFGLFNDGWAAPNVAPGAPSSAAGGSPPSLSTLRPPSGSLLRSSDVVGRQLFGPQGEDLGVIRNLVISPEGNVRFAIISTGGPQLVALPWNLLQVRNGGQRLVADVSRERLASAPHFSAAEWPALAVSRAWARDVDGYFAGAAGGEAAGFGQLDQNHPASEKPKTDEQAKPPSFASLDRNGDGKISRAEANAFNPLALRFDEFDTNHDGSLSPAEYDAFQARAGAAAGPSSRLGLAAATGSRPNNPSPAALAKSFENLDINQDGLISRDEAKRDKSLSERFSQFDVDKDGSIDKSEFSAFEERINVESAGAGGRGVQGSLSGSAVSTN